MFVRKKQNKSGVISVQIIDKRSGKYKLLKTIGSSASLAEVDLLFTQGQHWIKNYQGQLDFDFVNEPLIFDKFIAGIEQINIIGTELLLGNIFDEIGFSAIKDELFKKLVIARICYPASKLKTTDYFQKYHSIAIDEDKIYRYLDKLHSSQKDEVQKISYEHTLKILNNNISIVFYDVTTLYFEIDKEDELRKTGFSKEGKHQHPQIVLGLLVSVDGYPLAYDIFEGNKFEGHTMLPIIEGFKEKYKLNQLVIIADSGLLSNDNIAELQNKQYEYILGARIKNESQSIKSQIMALSLDSGQSHILSKDDQTKLIISYSEARAKKDKANREKGLKRLEKQIKSGKLTKASINNKGYNKYLKLEGEIKISIDKNKFNQDGKWDGLKGYLTNTKLTKEQIIENYNQLWKIEYAFRVTKTDLKIRPIYHHLKRRIEAHICIAFVAYKVYKELERQLKLLKANLSPEKAIDIAKTIYSIKVQNPIAKQVITQTLLLNEEQKYLANLFGF
jgi:transposase